MSGLAWPDGDVESPADPAKKDLKRLWFHMSLLTWAGVAQLGGRRGSAKSLKGFGGAGILEIVEVHASGAYRAVYTVRFAEVVYLLRAVQKKSKSGIVTPQHEIEMIRERLKLARQE